MKVACLQFAPAIGRVAENQKKCLELLDGHGIYGGGVDLLILPEMAFSGYVFESKQHIRPFIEHPAHGPTVTWARSTARRLNCFVQVGFPRCSIDSTASDDEKDGKQQPLEPWYNSVCLVDRNGEVVDIYDKHFLYTTDEIWAAEGESFKGITVKGLGGPSTDVKLGFAICMDINPYRFESPFTAFEFANFHRKCGTAFVSGSMAWLLSEDGMDEYVQPEDPSMNTLEYWVLRLAPLRQATRGSRFCGSSAVIEFMDGNVELLTVAGFNNECVIVADLDL
ncbi:Carbon-nitrogen hydrolase [Dinochytrium kinnereticum]|nr:Carbon-nitrogen hydrolase [Dinochytrium kinnereticum]